MELDTTDTHMETSWLRKCDAWEAYLIDRRQTLEPKERFNGSGVIYPRLLKYFT